MGMGLDASGHLEVQEQQVDAFTDLLLSNAAIKLNEFMDLYHVAGIPSPALLIQQMWSNLSPLWKKKTWWTSGSGLNFRLTTGSFWHRGEILNEHKLVS